MKINELVSNFTKDISLISSSRTSKEVKNQLVVHVAQRILGIVLIGIGAALTFSAAPLIASGATLAALPYLIGGIYAATVGHDLVVVGNNCSKIIRRIDYALLALGKASLNHLIDYMSGQTTELSEKRISAHMQCEGTWLFHLFI